MALNTIHVSFNGQNETITKKRYQYDKGQVCVFDDIELPEAYKVIFSNNLTGENSIPMIGGENGVRVPDDFFLTGLTIYGWVYLSEGDDDGQTVKHFTIPIEKRVRETDEEPTPEEQTEIEQALVALNNAVAKTAADVVTTTEKAEQAAASASSAAQSATTATEKAAETAAGVSRAEQAAEGAEAAKTAAQSAQTAAEGYAGAAGTSAQNASTSATQAAGSATSASGFAGDANTSAQAAASMATTASTKATEAAQSASTASTAATNAINAKTAAETAQGKAEDAQEAAETAQEAAETAVESIQGKTEQIDQNTEDIGDLKAEINQLSESIAPVESTATATAAHAVGELFMMGETLLVALSAIAVGDTITTEGGSPNAAVTTLSSKLLKDVQVNGTSVVNQGVANIPLAGTNAFGVIRTANDSDVKNGTNFDKAVVPLRQYASTFYGLAKAASDTTQSASSNPVGTYTDAAKKAIREMLGIPNFDSELIVDLTTTEDLAKLEITTDINGQPFNIWVAKIIIILPMSTTGATDYLSAMAFGRTEDGTDKRWGLPTLRFNSGISQSIMAHELEMFGHGVYLERSYNCSRLDASTNTMNTFIPAETDIKCLYGLRLYQYSANASLIPSGTRILIYGCRI